MLLHLTTHSHSSSFLKVYVIRQEEVTNEGTLTCFTMWFSKSEIFRSANLMNISLNMSRLVVARLIFFCHNNIKSGIVKYEWLPSRIEKPTSH